LRFVTLPLICSSQEFSSFTGGLARRLPDIVEGIRRIKAQDGPDVILAGSSTLTSTLLEHGLADEALLVVYPVLLGTGKRIFADGTPPRSFELVNTKPLPSGIVINSYKAAGPLKKQP
jgi:dihydrofolate reductase